MVKTDRPYIIMKYVLITNTGTVITEMQLESDIFDIGLVIACNTRDPHTTKTIDTEYRVMSKVLRIDRILAGMPTETVYMEVKCKDLNHVS
jgi:hypothetical protein